MQFLKTHSKKIRYNKNMCEIKKEENENPLEQNLFEKKFDLAIVGAGAAGLTAAIYAGRAGMKTCVFEDAALGQALEIAEVENYPGIFPKISGPDFINNLKKQAVFFGAKIISASCKKISKNEQSKEFLLESTSGIFTAKSVILANGACHKKLDVTGEKEFTGRGISYCALCDGHFFKDKEILLAGGGNSAFSQALYLSSLCKKITILHRRNFFKADKSLFDRVKACPEITIITNYQITGIEGKFKIERVKAQNTLTGQEKIFPCDGLFIFIGMQANPPLIEGLACDEKNFIKTDRDMKTNIEGLFAAGDCVCKKIRQLVTAASDGAIAANSAFEYLNG